MTKSVSPRKWCTLSQSPLKLLLGLTSQYTFILFIFVNREAANAIGDLQSCDTSQWAILLAKAVEGYGSITTWMPEVYSEVGSVIGRWYLLSLSHQALFQQVVKHNKIMLTIIRLPAKAPCQMYNL